MFKVNIRISLINMVLHFLCAPPSHHTRESFNRSNEAFMPLRKNLIGFCV